MRFLLGLVAALALLYAGYWFVGQRAVERAGMAAFAQLQAEGWEAGHGGIATRGFPSRFDTTITAPRLADPATGIGWEAPWLQLHALSYRPNDVIAIFPEAQSVILPGGRIDIRAQGLRARGKVGLSAAMPFETITLDSGPVTATSQRGLELGLADALLALRRAATGATDYDLWVEGNGLTVTLGRLGTLPRAAAALRIDATLTLDQPIDRAIRPDAQLRALALRQATVDFGATGLVADGALTLDAAGTPAGTVNLTVRDWRAALAIAVEAGLVPAAMAGLAETAGALMSRGASDLAAPLVFEGGQMRLGPVPLGPAPALHARG
jgi:hypothetical protein